MPQLMHTIRTHILPTLLLIITISLTAAAGPLDVRFHNEAADTSRITALLIDAARQLPRDATPGERVAYFGRRLLDTPYVAHTLENTDTIPPDETLTVDLDRLDCTTFVETVAALATTLGEGRTSWRDYLYNLRRLRYRGGQTDGYASRLHYIAEWAADGIHKGILTDATLLMPRNAWIVRTIDYMTTHRDAYPALADSTQFARIRRIEQGLRNHRFPYLRPADLNDRAILASLREGDIIAFVSTRKDLDVTHLGILVKESRLSQPAPQKESSDTWRVLHASSTAGRVVVSDEPLATFLKRNRHWQGIRLLRLLPGGS